MMIQIMGEAELDLLEGFRFYDQQSAGLGDYFLNSLFSDIDSLLLYAGIRSVHFGFYRLLSRKFPFFIYNRIEDQITQVWAVLDCRQDPGKISARLMDQ